jgi:23S rRNA (cytidine1920-2'-O)/16S rRNA (cytidine1409-2'-O)-methyltransferase
MALDVGKGQINWRIAQDPRVIRLEGINARYLRNEWLPQIPQLVTIDISFISLAKVLPAVTRALTSIERPVPMQLLALVKPQFELPQARVEPGGVVADAASRQEAVDAICHTLTELGWAIRGTMESLLTGAEGNRETFILCVFPVHSF